MAIKLLVADLDGTVLNNKIMEDHSVRAIKRAKKKGVLVTFATGRMHASAVKFAREAGIELPIITCNGAMVKTMAGDVLFEKCIEPALVREVMDLCFAHDWHLQWYIDDKLFVKEMKKDTWLGYESVDGIEICEAKDELDKYSHGVVQMVILNRTAEIDVIEETMQKCFEGRLFTPKTADCCIDIVSMGIHKAVGIEKIADQYDIQAEEIMAIGDSDNDVDMLKYAGFGVAMGNAFESLKEVADEITLPCDENGFAVAVEKYILDK